MTTPSPRTFTRADLATITLYEYCQMSAEDATAFDQALWAQWEANEAQSGANDLNRDYAQVDSRRSYELGE